MIGIRNPNTNDSRIKGVDDICCVLTLEERNRHKRTTSRKQTLERTTKFGGMFYLVGV